MTCIVCGNTHMPDCHTHMYMSYVYIDIFICIFTTRLKISAQEIQHRHLTLAHRDFLHDALETEVGTHTYDYACKARER